MHLKLVGALLLIALAGECWAQTDQKNALWQADMAFCRATREKGLDGWVSYFAEKAVLPQFDPPLVGPGAVRSGFQKWFAVRNLDFRWEPLRAEILPQGNIGYTTGRYSRAYTDEKGTRIKRTGNYITVWEKQPDGNWKVLSDFGSADPPAGN